MRININEEARLLYNTFCPNSSRKCGSRNELDCKIQRMVDLGKKEFIVDGHVYIYYYHLIMKLNLNNEIVSMWKNDDPDTFYWIKESRKTKYNQRMKMKAA